LYILAVQTIEGGTLTTPSHKILQMAAVLSAMGSAQATPPPHVELPPLTKLFGQLRKDAALRARFSLDPRSVFEETGIDPTPYDLPDRLDEDDVDRFLSNWTGARGPSAGSRATDAVAPVYGSLPGLPDFLVRRPAEPVLPPSEVPQPSDRRASGDEEEKMPRQVLAQAPVAPVYGPPPGLRNKLPEPVSPPTPAPEPREPQAPGDTQRSPHPSSSFGPAHAPVYGPPPGVRTKP
jgi:hypothetical protein